MPWIVYLGTWIVFVWEIKKTTFYQISNASYRLQTRKYNIKLQIIKEMQEETQNKNVENNYDK